MAHQTFWCHECDMSVTLDPSSSSSPTPLCPQCFSDLLELMDSSDDNYLLNSPFLRRLIHHLSTNNHDLLPSTTTTTTTTTTVPPSSLPASKASVDAIPTLKITSSMLDLDPFLLCAVCKDPFLYDVEAKQLPCNHLYHPHCILPWLSSHSSCPLCRFQLPIDTHPSQQQQQHHHHLDAFLELEDIALRFGDQVEDHSLMGYGGALSLSYIARTGTHQLPQDTTQVHNHNAHS